MRQIHLLIVAFWLTADDLVVGFTNLMDRAKLGRKIMLYGTLWITVDSYSWAKNFVNLHPEKSGLEIGAIIAAVLLPLSILQKAIFDGYIRSTGQVIDDSPPPPAVTTQQTTVTTTS